MGGGGACVLKICPIVRILDFSDEKFPRGLCLRRGYRVNIGKIDVWDAELRKPKTVEVDFVARKGKSVAYFQVSESITDPRTRERELASLQAIKDQYPKYILTRDHSAADYSGIRHLNVVRWMLEGV